MTSHISSPAFDPELAAALEAAPAGPTTITPEMIGMIRPYMAADPAAVIGDRPIELVDRTVPGRDGAPDVTLSILRRTDHVPGGGAIYFVHGGGLILGDRFFGIAPVLDWIETFDVVFVTPEYRLAPDERYPAALDDVSAGLAWTAAHAEELGFDAARLVLAGASAGGGLAAAAALRARDEGGPALAGQLLIYPMLDDRNDTVSSYQYEGYGRWDRGSNDTGWDAYLGELRRSPDLPAYAAPARATDLSGLPPTYLEVGSAEVFRDEDVAYATQLWSDGGDCELHVWPGGYHAFDLHVPAAKLTASMVSARRDWLKRKIGLTAATQNGES
ncbi:alpha/beta hydrolase fold domain-containing protein [Microbacterium sp. No. 7]|uniref:alpha/beta hydrolase fold domain-containing protein n=1 Tax=Microbacterium sp. No. 7 TaxID=1714373 RepID=UPI0006D0DD9F|nr:alpha/beta hydrolase fold domain-containing protein [Microbacterium sp. No. 7]ALJ21186.1 hypothetical protein AOA12_15255 [Microbacterium sp. No. 7]